TTNTFFYEVYFGTEPTTKRRVAIKVLTKAARSEVALEVMVLDHSGPDLAFIEMGAFCKLFFYSTLLGRLIYPFKTHSSVLDLCLFTGALIAVYGAIGITESVMARFRMDKVPRFILASFGLVFFATILTMEFI
ncbi:MAG: hypothetical protein QM498_17060, partial [Desulfobacterium sp.]